MLSLPVVTGATCSNQRYCRLDRPSIVQSVGELPCSYALLPTLVRLELRFPVNTAVRLQQSALLQARLSRCSADGGETTLFGGYAAHLCAVGIAGTLWAQQRAALLCRRDRPPLVRSAGKLLSSRVVLTLFADWHMYNPLLCYPLLHYCWADAARFSYGWRRDLLLCYPPLHYCWGRCCPDFMRLVREPLLSYTPYTTVGVDAALFFRLPARSFTALPPPNPTVDVDAARFLCGWCAKLSCPTPPIHYCWGKCCLFWCDECQRVGRLVAVLPPYTTPRVHAACFGAMSSGVLGDLSLCYPPYTTPRLNAACFGAMIIGVLGDPSLCYHVRYIKVKCCLFLRDDCRRVGRPFTVLPPTLHLD